MKVLQVFFRRLKPLPSPPVFSFWYQVSLDPDHKFDLGLDLGKLEEAKIILDGMPKDEYDTTDAQSKWKRLGDLALAK